MRTLVRNVSLSKGASLLSDVGACVCGAQATARDCNPTSSAMRLFQIQTKSMSGVQSGTAD
jgi:hypothetical protein